MSQFANNDLLRAPSSDFKPRGVSRSGAPTAITGRRDAVTGRTNYISIDPDGVKRTRTPYFGGNSASTTKSRTSSAASSLRQSIADKLRLSKTKFVKTAKRVVKKAVSTTVGVGATLLSENPYVGAAAGMATQAFEDQTWPDYPDDNEQLDVSMAVPLPEDEIFEPEHYADDEEPYLRNRKQNLDETPQRRRTRPPKATPPVRRRPTRQRFLPIVNRNVPQRHKKRRWQVKEK